MYSPPMLWVEAFIVVAAFAALGFGVINLVKKQAHEIRILKSQEILVTYFETSNIVSLYAMGRTFECQMVDRSGNLGPSSTVDRKLSFAIDPLMTFGWMTGEIGVSNDDFEVYRTKLLEEK